MAALFGVYVLAFRVPYNVQVGMSDLRLIARWVCRRAVGGAPDQVESGQDLAANWNSSCSEGPVPLGHRVAARAVDGSTKTLPFTGHRLHRLGMQAGWVQRWPHLPS